MTGTDLMDPIERKTDVPELSQVQHYKDYSEVLLLDLLRSHELTQEEYDAMT